MCEESDLRDLESNLDDIIALTRQMRVKAAKKASSWQCILDLGDGFT